MPALRRLLLPLLLIVSAAAAGDPAAPSPPAAQHAQAAPAQGKLEFANRTIFIFRDTLNGHTPQDRAEGARKRLDKALAARGPQQPGVHTIPEGTQVLLDGALLFLVSPADINPLAGDTTDSIARESAGELAKALQARREQDSPRYLLMAGAICLAASLAYALALRGLFLLHRWVRDWLARLVSSRVRSMGGSQQRVFNTRHYIVFVRQLVRLAIWALGLMLSYAWIAYVFGTIPLTRSWGERLQGFFVEIVLQAGTAIVEALPGLMLVAVIGVLARVVIRIAAAVFARIETGELQFGWLDGDTTPPTRRLFNVVVCLFALAMAYPYLPGSHTAAFQGVSVLAGLMVSIGASSIVAQGASGLILMYTRSLRKGEYVRIGDSEGTVAELGMFETTLRTGFGEEIMMPNAWVLSNTTKNFSRAHPGAGFVLDTSVTIGYDTPWRQVHALLELAASRTQDIAREPAPYVVQTALSDFYVAYRLVAYATSETPFKRIEVLNNLHQQIVDVFNEFGVQIMSPHFVEQPAAQVVVPREGWFAEPAVRPGAA